MRDRKRKRRYVSMALTMAMVMQLWAPAAAWAAVPVKKVKIITEFTELPEDVRHIQIPAGVSEEEFDQYLQFPETIEATVIEEYQEVGGHDNEAVKKPETATDSNAEREETEAEDDGNADADTELEQGELPTATDSNADREELPTATDSDADVIEAQEEDPADEPEDAEALENSEGSVVEILRIATDSNAEENDSNSINNSNSPGNSDNSGHEIFDDPEFEDEEILNDIPVLTDIPVTWEMDGLRETEDGSMYYLPVLPVEYVLADGVELPEIQVSVESGIALFTAGEVIHIEDVETTNGQIVINTENLAQWQDKILAGNVTSSDLQDAAKGLVIDGVELNLTIQNLTIDRHEYMRNGNSAISLQNGATLNLTLDGDNNLYGAYGGAGIGVPEGTTLHITSQSKGSLYAKGGNGYGGAAGIGSISPGLDLNSSKQPATQSCGTIIIDGGDIKAVGGTYTFRGSKTSGGAGIGGTYGASGGDIQINGGTVHAIGGFGGAGIGGGANGSFYMIIIKGGTVIAEGTGSGSRQPAAIGRGVDTNTNTEDVLRCGQINFIGGNITAKGNVGYGYVLSGNYPSTTIGSTDDVYLTVDGEINDGWSTGVRKYELNFTIFDTAFEEKQELKATVKRNLELVRENIAAKVETPGRVDFTLSFAHSKFLNGEPAWFHVTINEKTYEIQDTFSDSETQYHLIAGKELYPVDLEFYDEAITGDIESATITVKQNGADLTAEQYVCTNMIKNVDKGVGKMRVFLPANEGTTEITVQAKGVNSSAVMTRTGLTINKDGITSVVMCSGIVTLSAEVTKLNSDGVTIAVKSNALNWDLYARLETTEITNITPEQIESSNELAKWNVQNGTISKSNLGYNKQYYCYLVAKQEDRYSPIVCVKFATPYGARMFWENGDSKGYGRFLDAIDQTRDIAQEGFTIQALGTSEEWSGGYVTLQKSGKLDLNGKNITINNVTCSLALADGVSAVITDTAGGAEYHNGNSWTPNTFFIMNANTSLTIQGGNYYDYKDLLQNGDPSGRTLTIEGGFFHGNNYINIGNNGTLILSGGTFYGGLNVGGGGNEMGAYLKPGYCFHYLSGVKAGTYTTTLLLGTSDDIEVVPYPTLEGELTLTIGNGLYSQVTSGTTLTASFARKGNATGTYTYTWYRTDGTTETQIRQNSETTETTDTYKLTDYDIGKQIYCVVKEAQSSGSVESEKTYPVIGYSIENAVITLENGPCTYDGTEKKPKVQSVMLGENLTLVERTHYTVSYDNNIKAGENTAKVIITGKGIYEGTAEKTFTIARKSVEPTFEGVEKAYPYTESEIRPKFTLKDGTVVIPENEYTVSYKDNKDAGTATINVSAKSTGNYDFNSYKTFTIYQESVLIDTEIVYFYKEGFEKVLPINMNGNTFKEVVDEENQSVDDSDISMETTQGLLRLSRDFLNSLGVGKHSYKIQMWPQGNQQAKPLEYGFCVTVKKMPLEVNSVRAAGRTYNGGKLLNITEVILTGLGPIISGVSVDIANLQGTLESADAGKYSEITLPELTLTGTEADNYELIQPTDPVMILGGGATITKAPAVTITPLDKSYVYLKPTEENIDLSELLPKDCGETVFTYLNSTDSTIKNFEYYEQPPTIQGNILSYKTMKTSWSQVGLQKQGEIHVKAQTTNYEDMLIVVKLRLRDQTKVVLKDGMQVKLKNHVLTYGEPLSKLKFEDVVFTDEAGNAVQGTLGWGDDTWVPSAGTTSATWWFHADDLEYTDVYGDVEIAVNPAELTVASAAAEDRVYDKNSDQVTISAVTLSGVRDQDDVSVDIAGMQGTLSSTDAGDYTKVRLPELVLTGADVSNYKLVQPTGSVALSPKVTIRKADAQITWPIAGTIEAGNPLKDAALTGGSTEYGTFTWKNPEQKAEAGTHSYAVVFTPDAKMAKNYDIKTMTQMVELTATEPPKDPEKPSGDAGNTNGSNSSGNSSSSTGRDKDRDSSAGRATERNTWSEKKVGGTTRWRYYENTGRYARNTWKQLTYNGTISWYHFGADGYMDTGWFMDTDGRWYYLNPVSDGTQGAMKTGWFTDPQDGHRYYLDPKTGAMVTGWKLIDGIWYYFNETSSGTSGWSYSTTEKKWVYVDKKQKPLGILEENKKR